MNVIFKFVTIFVLLVCSSFAHAENPVAEYDWMEHNSSLLNYETYFASNKGIDNCFSTGKIIWVGSSELDQTYMPGTITKSNAAPPGSLKGGAIGGFIGNAGIAAGAALAGSAIGGGIAAGALLALVAGIEVLVMMDVCTNTYVVAPHEYFNREYFAEVKKCKLENGIAVYEDKNALTANDIPFFYHCNPMYDPIDQSHLNITKDSDAGFIGRTYGYMGAASQYCTGDGKKYGDWAEKNGLVGKIIVESAPWITRPSQYHDCTTKSNTAGRWTKVFGPVKGENGKMTGTEAYVYPAFLTSYYKTFENTGKIKMCVASTYTLLPIRAACGTIAPPGDENAIDPFLKAYVEKTRCEYLIKPREDLHALGNSLGPDEEGKVRKSVQLFLQSDFHFTSTVVGCLKDMINKIFIKTPSGYNIYNEKPFFQKVQERLKDIVLAVLILYIALSGIKIMTNPEPPKRAEWIMMIVKFALVVYFAIGTGFYEVDKNGTVKGLFPQIVEVTDELANMFLEAQNDNEGLGFCSYKYKGKNLLGENLYEGNLSGDNLDAGISSTNTPGFNGVKLTLWDLVDCKLINYLNLGTCDYTPSGLILLWIFGKFFWIGGYGFLISVAAFIYCLMLLLVIFRFAHIAILALLTVTILIFLAPVFIPFVLFEATKGIYQKWFTTIIGYLIYPALLFAFLAIMLATFDTIYYGDFKVKSAPGQPVDIKAACEGVDSIYCFAMKDFVTKSDDACDMAPGSYSNRQAMWNERGSLWSGDEAIFSKKFAKDIFMPILKLMVFSIIFYLFMGSITIFLSTLLGVQDMGGMAKGSINSLNALGAGLSGAASGLSSIKNLGSSKGKDDGGGKGGGGAR
ncbi:MAG: type secretion system protein VirB6 [Candidatus Midichloriaceae bacterium]|jgi:type IV secretion system protein VirB6|nr:type secretion system protein VirB6 [Candidatus Midichloriaceae bacterium]